MSEREIKRRQKLKEELHKRHTSRVFLTILFTFIFETHEQTIDKLAVILNSSLHQYPVIGVIHSTEAASSLAYSISGTTVK